MFRLGTTFLVLVHGCYAPLALRLSKGRLRWVPPSTSPRFAQGARAGEHGSLPTFLVALLTAFAGCAEKKPAPPPSGLPPLTVPSVAAPTVAANVAVVSGELRLDPRLQSHVAAGDVIFLVARGVSTGTAPAQIVAVKKMSASRFPIAFSLDQNDAMMMGTELSGTVVVSARVDKDGNATTKAPGDVTGMASPVSVPSSHVVVTLDQLL